MLEHITAVCEMDANDSHMRIDVDCKKPHPIVHSSDLSTHNGHTSTLNLSYQIVLQDHNYGAPFPPHNNDASMFAVQCKQEPSESYQYSHSPMSHSQRGGGIKTLPPRPSAVSPPSIGNRTNGLNTSLAKRQRTSSSGNTNGVGHAGNVTPSSRRNGPNASCKLSTPPLIPKSGGMVFPYAGDLNSHLYASISHEKSAIIKSGEQVKAAAMGTTTPNGSASGLSGYLGGWFRGNGSKQPERARSSSDMRDSFHDDDDSNGSFDHSPRMTGAESDHEGEETETANECEDEDDEDDRHDDSHRLLLSNNHDESVTRCICKFGHDDGYMICCDKCSVWQHVDCMNLDRNNIPDEFLCELCKPRKVDRARARAVQYRKRQEFRLSTPPPSGMGGGMGGNRRDRSLSKFGIKGGDEYIDVEKTPSKKMQRSYSTPGTKSNPNARTGVTKGQVSGVRGDGVQQRAGKRAANNPKLKLKREKSEESVPRKRKLMRSKNSETIDVGGPSSSSAPESSPSGRGHQSNGGDLLLQWIDHYEEAVTNHYSPELRARVSAVRTNGLGSEMLLPPSTTPVYRLASKAGGFKTLVASSPIGCGSPVIECRGKYMLASQLRPYKNTDGPGSGTSGFRPTPHIIFHPLATNSSDGSSPAPMLEMCVDGRSYGNEARFVWQSCQPNAEVKHKVEKGSVHLYLVAKTEILDSEEITVAHHLKNPLPCPYEGCPHMKNKDSGARTGLAQTTPLATTPVAVNASSASTTPTIGTPVALSPAEIDRKRRRRRTNSIAAEAPLPAVVALSTPREIPSTIAPVEPAATVEPVAVPATLPAPVAAPTVPVTPVTPAKRQQRTPSKPIAPAAVVTEGEDSQDGTTPPIDETDGSLALTDKEVSANKRKLSREERKMEAIMKAFEKMEKAQQRRQETIAKTHRKDSRDGRDDKDDMIGEDMADVPLPNLLPQRAVSVGGTLSVAVASAEKRVVIMGQDSRAKSIRRGKRNSRTRRSSSGVVENARIRMRALSGDVNSGHSATEEESEHGGSSSSPGQAGASTDRDPSTIGAFKCPKTKKVVFNHWSGDGGELNGAKGDDSLSGSISLSVPVCYMRNPNPRSPTRPFRAAHIRPSTLSSLKSPTGSASPDPHGEGGQSNDENSWTVPLPGSGGPGGSAKKRWLRQAISEETTETSESMVGVGVGGVGGIPANANESFEHVTPLKKRRMARASLSSETSFTPPSTPTPTAHSVSLNDNNQHESMSAIMILADKEESSIESLSANDTNSQATPPDCDDMTTEAVEPSVLLSKALDQQPPLNAIEPLPALVQVTSSLTDLTPSSNFPDIGESSSITTDEGSQTSLDASSSVAAPPPVVAVGECPFSSPTRLTWEFRAPDAQFMRPARQSADMSSDVAVTSTTSIADAATTPTGDYTPKPIKRKLSILEYRQRKQVAPNDSNDTPSSNSSSTDSSPLKEKEKETVVDSCNSEQALTQATQSTLGSTNWSDSSSNSSFEGDFPL